MAARMTSLYQIYYDDSQLSNLFPFAIPYKNEILTPFFENSVILQLVPGFTGDKIGVCSHALREKLRFMLPPRRELTQNVIESDYDVLLLSRNSKHHEMLQRAEVWHPGFRAILMKIFAAAGFRYSGEEIKPDRVVYFNHFIATREVYQAYVSELLEPAMLAMDEDKDIYRDVWVDSGYTKLKGDIPDNVREAWGFYPMHSFLCERMFSCWINNNDLKIETL